jgi:hypothetical protein
MTRLSDKKIMLKPMRIMRNVLELIIVFTPANQNEFYQIALDCTWLKKLKLKITL